MSTGEGQSEPLQVWPSIQKFAKVVDTNLQAIQVEASDVREGVSQHLTFSPHHKIGIDAKTIFFSINFKLGGKGGMRPVGQALNILEIVSKVWVIQLQYILIVAKYTIFELANFAIV